MDPPAGLESFCESNKDRLLGVLTLHCGDLHTAEELAQETLVKVCVRWRAVQSMVNPEAWMFRIAINLSNSYFRRTTAERRAKARLKSDPSHHDPDIADAVVVRQAVAALPKRQRSVVVLRFYADLSVGEVAEALDMPEGTVKTLTHRGIKSLRRDMQLIDLKEVSNVG